MTHGFGCFVRTGWVGIERENFEFSATSMAERAGADWKQWVRRQTGVALCWRSFSRVKLLEGGWHTAPNHSRPASCLIDADIDAEDQPEAVDPQKGH